MVVWFSVCGIARKTTPMKKILLGALALATIAIGLYLFEEKSRKFQMEEESSEKGAVERINEDGSPYVEIDKPSGDIKTIVTGQLN